MPLHAAAHVCGCVVVVPDETAGQKTFDPSQPVATHVGEVEPPLHVRRRCPASHEMELQAVHTRFCVDEHACDS